MSRVDDESLLGPIVRTIQISILALTVGMVVFLGTILHLRGRPKPAPPPAAEPAHALLVMSCAAIAFAVMAVPMSLLIPAVAVKKGRKQISQGTWTTGSRHRPPPQGPFGDTFKLATVYQASVIIEAALNVGAAFFALIAYLFEGLPAILGVAALLTLGVAARFPTRARVGRWIEAQNELLIQEQQANGAK